MLLTGTYAWGSGSDQPLGSKLEAAKWLRDSGVVSQPSDASILVQELTQYLMPETPDADRMNYFLDTIFLNGLPANDWVYEWDNFLATGDDTEVSIPLGRLITAILYAPEYQVG
jgi:hypothetical protein